VSLNPSVDRTRHNAVGAKKFHPANGREPAELGLPPVVADDHTARDLPTNKSAREAMPSLLSLFCRFGLLDGGRHLGDRHQGAGHLVQKLIGVLFFRQRLRQ
jgi:hypothetical protein